jgi:hypothetical protein
VHGEHCVKTGQLAQHKASTAFVCRACRPSSSSPCSPALSWAAAAGAPLGASSPIGVPCAAAGGAWGSSGAKSGDWPVCMVVQGGGQGGGPSASGGPAGLPAVPGLRGSPSPMSAQASAADARSTSSRARTASSGGGNGSRSSAALRPCSCPVAHAALNIITGTQHAVGVPNAKSE